MVVQFTIYIFLLQFSRYYRTPALQQAKPLYPVCMFHFSNKISIKIIIIINRFNLIRLLCINDQHPYLSSMINFRSRAPKLVLQTNRLDLYWKVPLTVFLEWLVLNTQSGSKISYFRSYKLTCIAANFPIRFSATIPGCRGFIFAILPIVDHFLVGDVRGTAPHIRLFVKCGTHAWSDIYIRYSYCSKAHLHKKSTTRGRFATDSATNSSRLKGKSNITTH